MAVVHGDIECVIDDARFIRPKVLQQVEIGSAFLVHGDHFSIDDGVIRKIGKLSCDIAELCIEVFTSTRIQRYPASGFHNLHAPPIELDLPRPDCTFRQLGHRKTLHQFYELCFDLSYATSGLSRLNRTTYNPVSEPRTGNTGYMIETRETSPLLAGFRAEGIYRQSLRGIRSPVLGSWRSGIMSGAPKV